MAQLSHEKYPALVSTIRSWTFGKGLLTRAQTWIKVAKFPWKLFSLKCHEGLKRKSHFWHHGHDWIWPTFFLNYPGTHLDVSMVWRNCQHCILATWMNNDPRWVEVGIDKAWIYDPHLGFLALMCEASDVFRAAGSVLKNRHHIPSHCALHMPATLFWNNSFKSMQQLPSEDGTSRGFTLCSPCLHNTMHNWSRDFWDYSASRDKLLHPVDDAAAGSSASCLQLLGFAACTIFNYISLLKKKCKKKKKRKRKRKSGHNDYNHLDQLWHLPLFVSLCLAFQLSHTCNQSVERWQGGKVHRAIHARHLKLF